MTDYDDLRSDLHAAVAAMSSYAAAVNRKEDAVTVELERIWTDVSELRDEVVALANRLEALTHFVTTSPAEVAEAMVKKHGVPCSECGRNVYVDHTDAALPSPIRNADDGTLHTCHVRAVNDA